MIIKFLTEQTFNTGYTLLHAYNFIYDTYRTEYMLKFFTDEMINNAKVMLSSQSLNEDDDYIVLPYSCLS